MFGSKRGRSEFQTQLPWFQIGFLILVHIILHQRRPASITPALVPNTPGTEQDVLVTKLCVLGSKLGVLGSKVGFLDYKPTVLSSRVVPNGVLSS